MCEEISKQVFDISFHIFEVALFYQKGVENA